MKFSVLGLAVLSALVVPAFADNHDSDWTFRIGAAHVSPNDDSGSVLGDDGVAVDSSTGLGFSFEYAINNRWGFEVLAALPFAHDIKGTGDLSGLSIGEVKHLPPTFSALYYLNDEKTFHLGFGLNYTTFVDDKTSNALTTTLGATSTDLELDDSFGFALKAGFDLPISDEWSFNGNLYYLDISTDADVIVDGNVATTVDVDINPWVVMVGVSTQF
ncbi:OmpW/AlkL family protein [Pleionea sediminis]|uniref:OmpW/AlkL family protein n=1 Tax=Pleionea sediminis TaxID=2569479 RepID=UPI0011856A48|nr:OmpW family outer membrane protein [Pleionea sediminis]